MCQKWLKCKTSPSEGQALANLSLMLLPSAALLLCGRLLLPCGVSERSPVPALRRLQQTLVRGWLFLGCCRRHHQQLELPCLVCELEHGRHGHTVCFARSATGVGASGRGVVKKNKTQRAVLNCTAVCCVMVSLSPQLSSFKRNGQAGIITYFKFRLFLLWRV